MLLVPTTFLILVVSLFFAWAGYRNLTAALATGVHKRTRREGWSEHSRRITIVTDRSQDPTGFRRAVNRSRIEIAVYLLIAFICIPIFLTGVYSIAIDYLSRLEVVRDLSKPVHEN